MEGFTAVIERVGINPYVDVPASVSLAFARRGNVPITMTLNGVGFRGTLVPRGEGRHRLYINTEMREGAHVAVGDSVHVALQIDDQLRSIPLPEPLRRALAENAEAERAWGKLVPSRRKEILAYLNALKRLDALARNIRKVIASLGGTDETPLRDD
jgi:hypothetical protein